MTIVTRPDGVQEALSQTNGAEDIFHILTDRGGSIHGVLTAGPGAATPKSSNEENPVALTNFADAKGDGDLTASFFLSFGPGELGKHFALDVNASSGGTWAVYLCQPNRIS